ncbi:hypothetical protein GG344DRAFT_68190 [Lentinula edodes]|nr:hypothetical protein GG344DRAFT_68190 [Lentinula edodes]
MNRTPPPSYSLTHSLTPPYRPLARHISSILSISICNVTSAARTRIFGAFGSTRLACSALLSRLGHWEVGWEGGMFSFDDWVGCVEEYVEEYVEECVVECVEYEGCVECIRWCMEECVKLDTTTAYRSNQRPLDVGAVVGVADACLWVWCQHMKRGEELGEGRTSASLVSPISLSPLFSESVLVLVLESTSLGEEHSWCCMYDEPQWAKCRETDEGVGVGGCESREEGEEGGRRGSIDDDEQEGDEG